MLPEPKVVQALTEREREVLILRYGLSGEEPKTLEEIGARFQLTRERIRQIEDASLRKVRLNGFGSLIPSEK